MKRAREPTAAVKRVVIDVGGTKLTTTTDTIVRSSYLAGMVDLDAFASDASHCAEIFLDRDPEIFACVLRLMRQQPHIAGLVPHEPLLCASVIAEADFLGFEALLNHVKALAYYNSREPWEDHPTHDRPARLENEPFAEHRRRIHDAQEAHKLQCEEIDRLFEAKDDAHALRRFDEVYGDVGAALRSGVLPAYFLERKPPKPEPTKKVIQLTPVQGATWLLVGYIYDAKYGHVNDYGPMDSFDAVVAQPAVVTIKSDTTLTDVTGGLASRTMLASDWFDALPSLNERQVKQSNLWTCIVVADTPPREFGFKEFRH